MDNELISLLYISDGPAREDLRQFSKSSGFVLKQCDDPVSATDMATQAPPDLILIDGGRQHLLTAKRELDKLSLHIPLVSIAKEKENIYTLSSPRAFRLAFDSSALHLLQRIRDEAHRFAISYHHVLRRKNIIKE